MALTARDLTTGEVVQPGDTITDFRQRTSVLDRPTRANSTGKDGKILVDGWEYYARVFNLAVTDESGA